MSKKLPDLEAWAIFAKVAEAGSFARAAQELDMSQATVSKAITRLESRINTMLIQRTPRNMSLTDTGYAALERATRILQEGTTVEEEIAEKSSSLRGLIRISVPMSFGLSRLTPILTDFLCAHPDIELDIHFDDRQVDLIAERFDFVLRIANLIDSSLLARRLCQFPLLLVGSPSYFARHGKPEHPRNLVEHKALKYSYTQGGTSWRFHHKEQGDFTYAMNNQMLANNAEALTPGLLAGLGIALQPEFLIWNELQSGALIPVMEDWQVEPLSLHIVTPPGRKRPARTQALIDYILHTLTQEPWAHFDEGTMEP